MADSSTEKEELHDGRIDKPAGSKVESDDTPAPSPAPPPDGGFRAWFQCFAGFCVFCDTWGLPNSFGFFQSYYGQVLLKNNSASQISWIGTVQSFFILFGSIYAGPLYDRGYMTSLLFVGSFMIVFGMMMTSLCTEYWQVLLAQGFFVGLGFSCLFIPTPGVISSYFVKKRSWAIAIATCGSSVAGAIYPVIFAQLIDRVGFGWTVRILAFIILALQIPVVAGLRMRVKPKVVRRIFAIEPCREPEYALWAFAYFFSFIGLYVPYFYIQLQAEETGLVTGDLNFYLLSILNGVGLFGRLISGYLGDRIGPINAYTASNLVCAILQFCQPAIHNAAGVVAFAALYGFFSGAVVGLFPTVVAVSLTPNLQEFGVRWTMMTIPPAVGLLIGNPIAGAVLARGGYSAVQYMAGASMIIATGFGIASRVAKVGWSLRGAC